jgi:Fe-S-cluster containining protein
MNHCQKKCLGYDGYHGGCCTLDDRDYIIGPVPDTYETLERVRNQFPNVDIEWNDLFITFEEGSKLFPNKSTWQNPNHYPCMRVNVTNPNIPCIFYNQHLRCCQIQSSKSILCSAFKCEYLQSLGE